MLAHHERRHILEHRHVDRLALACLLATIEREADALRGDQAGGVVAHHHRHEARFAKRALEGAGDAGQALHDRIVGGTVVVAATATEGENRAMDEPRIVLGKARMVEAGARQCLGPDVAHEDVGPRDQPAECGEPVGLLQVEQDRALVAVEVYELARHTGAAAALGHGAQQVAAGRLDFDHVGAIVGEGAAADRADNDGRQIDDPDSRERSVAHTLNSSSISPQSTPFLSAAQIDWRPSFAGCPRTSIKSPTQIGCTRRAV